MRTIKHARNPAMYDYTLCGLAFDAYESCHTDEQVLFANDNERITCADCRLVIRETRKIRLNGRIS